MLAKRAHRFRLGYRLIVRNKFRTLRYVFFPAEFFMDKCMSQHRRHFISFLFATIVVLTACGEKTAAPANEVVIYTSVDQVYSEPVFKTFEEKSGIRVKAVYDVEAAKTTGLVARLEAEKSRPQADVFWNGEFAQTLNLAEKGLFEAYKSPSAADISDRFN